MDSKRNLKTSKKKNKSIIESEKEDKKELATRKRKKVFLNTDLLQHQSTVFLELLSTLTYDLVFRVSFYPKFAIDYISPIIESFTGYPVKKFYNNVAFCLKMIHPDDRPYYERLFKNKRIFKGPREFRVVNKNKSVVWLELNAILIRDTNNRVIGQEGIAKVITDRKQAETAIKTSKKRLETIIENGPVGIFLLDSDGNYSEANKVWTMLMGYSVEEMVGKPFLWNIYNDDVLLIEDKIQKLKTGRAKEFRTETRYISKDKSVFWVELYISVVKDSGSEGNIFIGIATDISERVNSEKQLKAYQDDLEKKVRERTYELLLALERNKTEIKDRRKVEKNLQIRLRYEKGLADFAQGLLLSEKMNEEAFTNSLEYLLNASESSRLYIYENYEDPKDGLCMRLMNEVYDKEPSHRFKDDSLLTIPYSEGYDHWREAMTRGEPVIRTLDALTSEERRFMRQGKAISMIALPISAENTWYGFIGFDSVKKDHWWNEEDVRLLRTASAILGVYKERKKIEREMLRKQKLESLALLAGGIAHDFNNFLSGILLSTSIAKRYVEPQSQVFSILSDAEQAAKRASNLSYQLVTFTKGGESVMSIVSISRLLKDTVNFALTGSGVSAHLDVPEDLWFANVDKGQISQVIYNIILNALQAMSDKGKLIVKASDIKLHQENDMNLDPGEYIKISITDTGVGIKEENLLKIFDPYYTTKAKGTGLGLTMSYSIIENHKGYLGVNSVEGHGSTFIIYLPAIAESSYLIEETEEKLKIGIGRILIMDDEEVILISARKGLTLLGYDVSVAVDGLSAVKQYKKAFAQGRPFSAVILDLTVSGKMGGKDAAKLILEIDPQARIIMSSGYLSDPAMSDYKKFSYKASLLKPYTIEELGNILAVVLKINN